VNCTTQTAALPDRTGALTSQAASESPPRCPPHRNLESGENYPCPGQTQDKANGA